MVRILLRLKNRLLLEALWDYLSKTLNGRAQIIVSDTVSPLDSGDIEVVILDPASLRETSPGDFPSSKKILLDTGLLDQEIIFYFLYYNLSGVFSRDTAPELIGKCVEVVLKGEIWLSKNLMKIIWEDLNSFSQKDIPSLTQKEREIVRLICEGLTNRDIAERLHLSEQTVKSHINRIFKKTGAKNRSQLLRMFLGIFSSNGTPTKSGNIGMRFSFDSCERVRKKLVIKSKSQ